MKKLIVLVLVIFLGVNLQSFSQAVDDRAVVPVAVTLNSILRLNIKSGGNIEFNFNTLDQYENGIDNSEAHDTKLTIASSTNWDLEMYAEDSDLLGTDSANTANSMSLDYIGYGITYDGVGDAGNYTYLTGDGTSADAVTDLRDPTSGDDTEIIAYDGTTSNAGGVNQNAFTVHWRCGTQEGDMQQSSLLEAELAADRYATNVFFILKPAD
ncbi:MAG: hypothetical protein R6U04_00530 [Bacteroidales bacterium]